MNEEEILPIDEEKGLKRKIKKLERLESKILIDDKFITIGAKKNIEKKFTIEPHTVPDFVSSSIFYGVKTPAEYILSIGKFNEQYMFITTISPLSTISLNYLKEITQYKIIHPTEDCSYESESIDFHYTSGDKKEFQFAIKNKTPISITNREDSTQLDFNIERLKEFYTMIRNVK